MLEVQFRWNCYTLLNITFYNTYYLLEFPYIFYPFFKYYPRCYKTEFNYMSLQIILLQMKIDLIIVKIELILVKIKLILVKIEFIILKLI